MDVKAPTSTYCLHTETRINLEPSSPATIVQLQLPSTSAFSLSSRIQRKVLDRLFPSKNEDDFRVRHVATSGSIYFRSTNRYPRSILWRCVENSRCLELRSLDLNKAESEARDAGIILRIIFSSPICNQGVTVADSAEDDIISVFAFTNNNDLYTLSLRPAFFCKLTVSEDNTDRWCRVFRPSSLSISNFHRLSSSGAQSLLIALADGRVVHLSRKQGQDGSQWDEAAYSDGQWASSLRGLIRWQGKNTVKFDGNTLDQNTVVEATISPDQTHLVAVGLNHTLKFWNLKSGQPTVSKDLLDVRREPGDVSRYMLNPRVSRVLNIFETQSAYEGDVYYAITFSPQSSGIFKVWGVRDADYAASGVRDLFSEDVLRLPDPDDGALWTMADFHVKSDSTNASLDVWILMRLNRRYKLYHRQFSELSVVGTEWQYGWTATAFDQTRHEPSYQPPVKFSDTSSEDVANAWLDFITLPCRIPDAVLETAIYVYRTTHDAPFQQNDKSSLRDKIALAVGSQLQLQIDSSAPVSVFQDQLRREWLSFWNTILEIEHMRWDPLSLGFDIQCDVPYVVYADGCSIVRELTEIETLAYNQPTDLTRDRNASLTESIEMEESAVATTPPGELSTIIAAAATFRAEFPESLKVACQHTLQAELWLDSSLSVSERIQGFYESCNFEVEIGDQIYNRLRQHLQSIGGFNALTTDAFLSIIEMLPKEMSEASGLVSTTFGLRSLVKGTQDMIALHLRLITDLLYLLVFSEVDVDREEFSMENLDSGPVYSELLDHLRQIVLAQWLGSNTRDIRNGNSGQASGAESLENVGSRFQCTILEDLFARDIKPQSFAIQSQSYAFTQTIRDVLTWISGANQITLDKVLVNIQCDLLKNGNIDLASSFLQYQPSTAWATYIRGRLSLEKKEHDEAAHYFKKAAFKLCKWMHFPPKS